VRKRDEARGSRSGRHQIDIPALDGRGTESAAPSKTPENVKGSSGGEISKRRGTRVAQDDFGLVEIPA